MSSVVYNHSQIEYSLTFKKVKNLNLRIKPDGSVYVSAPYRTSQRVIDDFVLVNAEKILAAQKRFAQNKKTECKYQTGDSVKLLGDEYILSVYESDKNYYSIEDSVICLFVKNSDAFVNRQNAFFDLCRDLSERIFPQIFSECYPEFKDICKEIPQLKLRNMKSQWGNCRPKQNIITLSIRLVQFDVSIIRFVIFHEFCHFYEANHSAAFYFHLNEKMPEWKSYDRVLKGK